MRSSTRLLLPLVTAFGRGDPGTKAWRMFLKSKGASETVMSPWHDLSLTADAKAADGAPSFLFVSEIPRGTRAKMEVSTREAHNPIAQDIFKKKPNQPLRFFTYGDIPFNYGMLPRTWENPDYTDPDTACKGDGDPLDVVHIGPVSPTGEVSAVRVLGVLGMIDEGETDWKILVESAGPDGFGSLSKVPREVQRSIVDWFRNYKTTDGSKPNEFAFNGEFRDADYALKVIEECAEQYKALRSGKVANTHTMWLPPTA